MITATDIKVSLVVPASPQQVFERICEVHRWWTNDLTGTTTGLGSKFTIRFADTFVDFRINEFTPGEAVSWHADDASIPWLKDDSEWTGTTVQFLLAEAPAGTRIDFTHFGLTADVECYEDCTRGWEYYIGQSLRNLVTEGKGDPAASDLHQLLHVRANASEVFEAICNVPGWFSEEFEGESRSEGNVFQVQFGARNMLECRVRTTALGKRIVWEVIDARMDCQDEPAAWKGHTMFWSIRPVSDGTEIRFAHKGLTPDTKSFEEAERGWGFYLRESLGRLIEEGKGRPGVPVSCEGSHE